MVIQHERHRQQLKKFCKMKNINPFILKTHIFLHSTSIRKVVDKAFPLHSVKLYIHITHIWCFFILPNLLVSLNQPIFALFCQFLPYLPIFNTLVLLWLTKINFLNLFWGLILKLMWVLGYCQVILLRLSWSTRVVFQVFILLPYPRTVPLTCKTS